MTEMHGYKFYLRVCQIQLKLLEMRRAENPKLIVVAARLTFIARHFSALNLFTK